MSAPIPIYVISLERSTDRRAHVGRQLDALGLSYEWIPAIDATRVGADALRSMAGNQAFDVHPWIGRALTASEVGCALTHAETWRRIAEGNAPAALVLEDDVDVHRHLPTLLQHAVEHAGDAHVVLFGHHSSRQPWVPGAPFDHRHGALTTFSGRALSQCHYMAPIVEYAQGAYAYLVTRAGAAALLKLGTPIRMPADSVTGYAATTGVHVLAVTPPCVVPSAAFKTTMTGVRPCPCRVCSAARLKAEAEGRAMLMTHEELVAGRQRPKDRLRSAGGKVLLFLRRLGVRPGSFWAPPGLFGTR